MYNHNCNKRIGRHLNLDLMYKGKRLFVAYYERGKREDPPILILHGLGGSHLEWERLVLPYLKIKKRVIVLDLPGHGLSGSLKNPTFDDFVEVVKLFLDKKKITKIILVGQSMGAALTLMFARKYPEMVAGAVAQGAPYRINDRFGILRFIVHNIRVAARIYPPRTELWKGLILYLRVPEILAWTLETYDMLAMSPEFARKVIKADARHVNPSMYIDLLHAFIADFDLREELAQISEDVPILLVDGDRVRISTIDTLKELSTLIPHASTCVIKDAGHLAPLSHPQEFCGILERFIQKIEK